MGEIINIIFLSIIILAFLPLLVTAAIAVCLIPCILIAGGWWSVIETIQCMKSKHD